MKTSEAEILDAFREIHEGELRRFYISHYVLLVLEETETDFVIAWFLEGEDHLYIVKREKNSLYTSSYRI